MPNYIHVMYANPDMYASLSHGFTPPAYYKSPANPMYREQFCMSCSPSNTQCSSLELETYYYRPP